MLASFTVLPIGKGEQLNEMVAEMVQIIKSSGLDYKVGAMQTTLEGDREKVMAVIMQCHARMRELAPRVMTQINIDDREGAEGRLAGKVEDLEKELGGAFEHE